MTGTDMTAGTIIRHRGERGLYRAAEPCQRNLNAWWFLEVNRSGVTVGSGWRAFRLEDCQPVKMRKATG
jgi:hypothetical protein